MTTQHLPVDVFATVVRHAPLVSIDLIVRDAAGLVLVGLRTNRPAQGAWFVPGGRIAKEERLDAAFARISHAELGIGLARSDARFLGVYEHLYADNFSADPTFGTHYVVLGYAIAVDRAALRLPRDQHSGYRWVDLPTLSSDASIHANSQAYAAALR